MEMWGPTSVKEIFVRGEDKPALIITMKKPTIEEVEPSPKEATENDSSILSIPEGSPMKIDEEQQLERRRKRSRMDEEDDEEPLDFGHMKRPRAGDIIETSEDEESLEGGTHEDVQHEVWRGEGPSDPRVEIWEELWDTNLAKTFYEHNWAQGETKILRTAGAGAGRKPEEPEDEFILPTNPNDIKLIPRFDVDSVVGDIDEVLDREILEEEVDVYTPLTWEEMWDFDEERAREMREAEKGYEEWLKDCQESEEIEEVDLISKSDDF